MTQGFQQSHFPPTNKIPFFSLKQLDVPTVKFQNSIFFLHLQFFHREPCRMIRGLRTSLAYPGGGGRTSLAYQGFRRIKYRNHIGTIIWQKTQQTNSDRFEYFLFFIFSYFLFTFLQISKEFLNGFGRERHIFELSKQLIS